MKKKYLSRLTFLLLLTPVVLASAFARAESAEELLQKASESIRARSYQKAVSFYQDALKLEPNNPKAHLFIALAYGNIGEMNKAVSHAEKAVKLDPNFQAYRNLALIYANKADIQKSKEAYKKALELSPASFKVWYELGLLNAGSGNFKEAVEAYEKSVALNPRFEEAYLGLGGAYYQLGDKNSAFKQAGQLKLMGSLSYAKQLEDWIKKKEARQNPSEPPAADNSAAEPLKS